MRGERRGELFKGYSNEREGRIEQFEINGTALTTVEFRTSNQLNTQHSALSTFFSTPHPPADVLESGGMRNCVADDQSREAPRVRMGGHRVLNKSNRPGEPLDRHRYVEPAHSELHQTGEVCHEPGDVHRRRYSALLGLSINVFHIGIGMGGPEAYSETLKF